MLIFLYGEDQFRSRQKLTQIKEKYLYSDKSGSGLSIFDCEEEKEVVEKTISVLGTPNLLAPKRLIICKNFIISVSDIEQKRMIEFFKKKAKEISDGKESVLVFWEGSAPKKSNTFFKILEKYAQKQNFEKLTGAKLNSWALKIMQGIDSRSKISQSALEKLCAYCQEEAEQLFSEIQKLINYCEGRIIQERDVELLVKSRVNSNIFATVDALGSNNKKEALRLLHEHIQKGDDPFYLMSMFFYQFRNLLKVADLRDSNAMLSEYEIARSAKMHPFVVKKSLAQIRNFSFQKLKSIYNILLDMDVKIKTGKVEIRLALDKFVAEL
jgi:DNA polymerase-3 subunit delta